MDGPDCPGCGYPHTGWISTTNQWEYDCPRCKRRFNREGVFMPIELDEKPLWYVCHPVAPDARYTFEQNMAHALKVTKILYDAGFDVITPWHMLCSCIEDSGENRLRGLRIDCKVIKRIGRAILTGHRISAGMHDEVAALIEWPAAIVIDVTGVHDSMLAHKALERAGEMRVLV